MKKTIATILALAARVEEASQGRVHTSGLAAPIIFLLFFFALSCLFTLLGMKKKSIGLLIPALICGFISTTGGCVYTFIGLGLPWLISLANAGIYVAMMVLSSQNKNAGKSSIVKRKLPAVHLNCRRCFL